MDKIIIFLTDSKWNKIESGPCESAVEISDDSSACPTAFISTMFIRRAEFSEKHWVTPLHVIEDLRKVFRKRNRETVLRQHGGHSDQLVKLRCKLCWNVYFLFNSEQKRRKHKDNKRGEMLFFFFLSHVERYRCYRRKLYPEVADPRFWYTIKHTHS